MIIDCITNKVFLSELLKLKHNKFYSEFKNLINKNDIPQQILTNTKDIWAIDFMPIQVRKDKFVQFTYNPDYLQYSKALKDTISDVNLICKELNIQTVKSDIILDGGNVINTSDKVIMCDKVVRENHKILESDLKKQLSELFEVDEIIFIPTHPNDEFGHADGVVRMLDEHTVLINKYPANSSKDESVFAANSKKILQQAGFETIEIPYNPYKNKEYWHANGVYINFLQMQDLIVLPIFNMKEDDIALKLFENLFPHITISTLNCNEIAYLGGVLNCISWNILD